MYKDVIHEDSLEIEGENKAPDYAFRIGGQRKFFVEAKKPAVKIETDIHPAFQLRRYAWSAKLPLGILSDFEEFAVYDCRAKPDKKDKASVGRVRLYSYKDYIEKWDEIAGVFSREAVLRGSFDAFAEGTKLKKGTAEVDDAFLEEIERWRDLLATNIALKNESLSVRELNYAVQMTIDRIVFLRICEDRGVERDEQLKEIGAGSGVYEALCQLFKRADARYNSGLFHFSEEKDASSPTDSLTLTIQIDDKPLKDILRNLYYPESPYVFREIPADILGQVYERFLGKVIRLTASHRAKVEEKPEVRKAGGVYYTPTYIVEYIVENTVGKLLEGKTPKEVEKIRVLDPACGSGTFPLGAYQYLLDWHLKWYMDNEPEKWATGKKPVIFQTKDGYRLTTSKKKDILLNNIYGVDIDPQAVEVTKLSLLLKVLEGESHETIGSQLALFQERVLPDLGRNIKCGNSLIGNDYFEGRQLTMLVDEEERYRVNAFDWKAEFPQVFIQGGFDAVIGNPPYGAELTLQDNEYVRTRYEVINRDIDTYALFIELSLNLCKADGRISMIVPTGWYSGARFSKLRKLFVCITNPEIIVNLPYDIFKAWVDTTIFVANKRDNRLEWPRKLDSQTKLITFPKRYSIKSQEDYENKESDINIVDWFDNGTDEFLTYANTKVVGIIRKIENASKPLSEFADVQRGVTPFNLEEAANYATSEPAFSGTVRRYSLERGDLTYIRFDSTLAEYKPEKYFKGPRLLLRELISRQFRLQAVKATDDFVTNKSMQSILQLQNSPDLNYLLGMLNSRLTSWYFLSKSNVGQRDDFPKIVLKETRLLPIRPINFDDPADKARHDKLVSLVERMLALHKQAPRTPQEQEMLKREIESTDKAIDSLVYELYGLSEEEIRIVEG
ncbi:MAG TPA: N-6 DNA methylase [Anaerolineales bacterium]|nr:N-6 DNA methylase [Anaerolineales bacterium]